MPHTKGDMLPGAVCVLFWKRQDYRDRKHCWLPGGWGRGLATTGTGKFEADGNILYLDQDGGYRTVFVCQTSKNCTLECSLHLDKPDIAKDPRLGDVPISWVWPWVSEGLLLAAFLSLSVFCVSFYFKITCGRYLCVC